MQPFHDSPSVPPSCPSEIVSISCFLIFKVSVLLLSEQHLTARYHFCTHHAVILAKTKTSIHLENYTLLETAPWLRVLLLLGKSLVASLLLSLTTTFWYRRHSTKRKQD